MIIKKYIYDKTTRILHASIGISVIALFVTGKLATVFYEYNHFRLIVWDIHIFIGYFLAFLLVYRVIWFVIGNEYAKFKNYLHFQKIYQALISRSQIVWQFGHHPIAGFVYLIFYILLICIIITGSFLARIEHDLGPIPEALFDDMNAYAQFINIHELFSNLILVFFIMHILALFKHQFFDGVPIITSMKDGYQYKKIPGENNEENTDII